MHLIRGGDIIVYTLVALHIIPDKLNGLLMD
jgi:hypothetical protein